MARSKRVEVHDYAGLQQAMRERADSLGISRLTIDNLSGLPNGYSGKLLCVPPMKKLGPLSLGLMLKALGLKLIVAEDPEGLAKLRPRMEQRKRSPMHVVTHMRRSP